PRRSGTAEATIVAAVASAAGLGFGLLIAIGLRGLLNAFGIKLPSTGSVILTRTVVAAIVVGMGTTLVSSVMPAIRAARVPPVAAMRETEPATYRGSKRRTVTGLAVTAAGVALLMAGLFGGGTASLVGLG